MHPQASPRISLRQRADSVPVLKRANSVRELKCSVLIASAPTTFTAAGQDVPVALRNCVPQPFPSMFCTPSRISRRHSTHYQR
jgi:hypothetical protein